MIFHADEPLSVSQIIRLQPDLTANIVQPAIRKLLKPELIEIADISINHNILARRFQPTIWHGQDGYCQVQRTVRPQRKPYINASIIPARTHGKANGFMWVIYKKHAAVFCNVKHLCRRSVYCVLK